MEPTEQGLYLAVSPLRMIACGYVHGELATLTFALDDDAAGVLALQILAQLQLHQQIASAAKDVEFLRNAGGVTTMNAEYFADVAPYSVNHTDRTVDVVWYGGASVPRMNYTTGQPYKLRLDMKGAKLDRLNAGAPVFDSHMNGADLPSAMANTLGTKAQIGVVQKAWADGTKGRATLKFDSSSADPNDPANRIWGKISTGIIKNLSFGAWIYETKPDESVGPKGFAADNGDGLQNFVAGNWEPFEISAVSVPADFTTAYLSADVNHTTTNRGEINMQENTTTAAGPCESLFATAMKYLSADVITSLRATGGTDPKALGSRILEELAKKDAALPQTDGHNVQMTRDHNEGMIEAMSESIACRYRGGKPSDRAREFMGSRMTDLAREICHSNGLRPPRDAAGIIRMASTTSDFPNLTQATGNRILLQAYNAAQSPLKQIARERTAPDFRLNYRLRIGEAPKLIKVNEAGEITQGSRAEAVESYKLYTYARIFGVTREALINDDLSAFSDSTASYGQAAASLEAQVLADLLYGGAGVGPDMEDANPLFHSSHGNVAGSGGAIGDVTLTAARLALRTTTGLDGSTIIETTPKYLLTPAALETTAQKALAAIYPATTANANVFIGSLTLLTDPRLDAKSITRWWLFGDPAAAPVLEYSYLAGAPGPQVTTRLGWDVLGMEIRAVLDFGAGAIGFRGAYSNAGA